MTLTRKRTVTPESFASLAMLPPEVRLTEHGLRLFADDHGRGRANIRLILAELYPHTSEFNEQTITDHLMMLAEAGAIDVYPHPHGGMIFQIVDWPNVDRPGRSDLPAPPDWQDSRKARESFASASRNSRESFVAGERAGESASEESGREGEGESESGRAGAGREAHSRELREQMPPSPFCPAHEADGGVEYPCIPCQNARLHHQHFLAQRRFAMRNETGDGSAKD